MSPETASRLAAINRAFYEVHATEFSDTRTPSGSELAWILPWIPADARVLDLGCGNGRAARLLARHGFRGVYVGIDWSKPLLRLAQESLRSIGLRCATLLECDLLREDVAARLAAEGLVGSFDVVLLLAVLHHIPTEAARRAVLARLSPVLCPRARVLVSTWQFMDSERMRRKILPWSVAGIDEAEVDPADALLRWKGGGYRYCHWIGREELEALAQYAGLRVVSTARAGGKEGILSLCAVLTR